MKLIDCDIKYLAENDVMDHSLLVVVETNPAWVDQ